MALRSIWRRRRPGAFAPCGIAFLLTLVTTIISAFSDLANAGIVNAASAARSDVARAVASAKDGDTVVIPAGTATWTTALVTTAGSRALTIQGAGTGRTIIYDNVPKERGGEESVLWSFKLTAGKTFRLTGLTIRGQAQDSHIYNKGTLVFSGWSHSVRVDHVEVFRPGTGAMIFQGDLWGVVDRCNFDTSNFKQAIQIFHGNWNGNAEGWGDGSFEDSLHLGTERAIYVEDCTFLGKGVAGAGVIDGTRGGRFVFRHNTVTNDNLAMHGTEGFRGRGVRSYEIYSNTFVSQHTMIFTALYLRSGTGVVFDNTFSGGSGHTGYKHGLLFTYYRVPGCSGSTYEAPWGMATGSNPWDGNTDESGYPALDQPGRGKCAQTVSGTKPINQTTGAQNWPQQASEPVYVWGNHLQSIVNNPTALVSVQCSPSLIQQNRDFFVDTPMAGYLPFIYPHPLVSDQGTRAPLGPTPPPAAASPATDAPSSRRGFGAKSKKTESTKSKKIPGRSDSNG